MLPGLYLQVGFEQTKYSFQIAKSCTGKARSLVEPPSAKSVEGTNNTSANIAVVQFAEDGWSRLKAYHFQTVSRTGLAVSLLGTSQEREGMCVMFVRIFLRKGAPSPVRLNHDSVGR